MIVARAFANKRYAVLGLARSGLATVRALVASGAHVTAWDAKEEARAQAPSEVTLADPLAIDLAGFDGMVVSPGVPINRHPIADHARKAGVPIIGDIELFALARALIHHILETAGIPSRLGGNIGLPILSQEALPEGGVYVLELSSYQIDLTRSLACDVAVLTNITPDHLDRYDGFADYAAAKERLFTLQHADQTAVIATGDDPSRMIASRVAHRLVRVSAHDIADQTLWPSLQGPHNAQNVACAKAVARALGVDDEAIEAGLRSYPGLAHRMERVRERAGVLFVNDSKATNPTSTAPALAAYPVVHWILGGQAKADDLDACAPHFGHVKAAYTIGEAASMFAALLKPHMVVTQVDTLNAAVEAAARAALPGETVLLSPACASFDQFRDFEARGDAFRALVEAL